MGRLRRMTNLLFEGGVSKQAGLPVSFGGLCCRRTGDRTLPSFLVSMNSVCELEETFLFRTNIADTDDLSKIVVSWVSNGASLLDHSTRQKPCDRPVIRRNCDLMLLEADQLYRARLQATAQRERARPVLSLGTPLISESLRVVCPQSGLDVYTTLSCWCGGQMYTRSLHGFPANAMQAASQGT